MKISNEFLPLLVLWPQVAAWGELEQAWLARTGGVPFHATDCDSDLGDYAGNPHQENKALYRDLVQILCASSACGFGAAIDLAAHREFFPGVPQDTGYYKCFFETVYFLKNLARDHFKIRSNSHLTADSKAMPIRAHCMP